MIKEVTKRKIGENKLSRSAPGKPDTRRITCTELTGSLKEFCEEYLTGIAEVVGPAADNFARVVISAEKIGRALRTTVLRFAQPIKLCFSNWDDELCLNIESSSTESEELCADVVDAWRSVGFRLKYLGFAITLTIPFDRALRFVARKPQKSTLVRDILRGYEQQK